MQLKSRLEKLKELFSIFIKPFLVCISFTCILGYWLRFELIDPTNVLHIGIGGACLFFFLWFKQLHEENVIKKIIIESSKSVFSVLLPLSASFNLHIFQFDLNKSTELILTSITVFTSIVIGLSYNFNKNIKVHTKSRIQKYVYTLLFTVVIIASTFIYTHNLGGFDFKEDEFQVVNAAAGYLKTNTFYKWDWLENKSGEFTSCIKKDKFCEYTRAWPHTYLVSKSFQLFGISEFSARIVSAIFGIFFLIFVYIISKFFLESKISALCTTFICSIYPLYISLFRNTRMYALLLPLFSLLVYFIYRGLTERSLQNFTTKRQEFIFKNFNFQYKFLGIASILLVINTVIHVNSLIIFPIVYFFSIYLAIVKKEKNIY